MLSFIYLFSVLNGILLLNDSSVLNRKENSFTACIMMLRFCLKGDWNSYSAVLYVDVKFRFQFDKQSNAACLRLSIFPKRSINLNSSAVTIDSNICSYSEQCFLYVGRGSLCSIVGYVGITDITRSDWCNPDISVFSCRQLVYLKNKWVPLLYVELEAHHLYRLSLLSLSTKFHS